jgi:hypothetical protein
MTKKQGMAGVLCAFAIVCPCLVAGAVEQEGRLLWEVAQRRSRIFADCAKNAEHILGGWLKYRQDPKTHLYPDYRGTMWTYEDSAADNYSSLVFMAYFIDPQLLDHGAPLRPADRVQHQGRQGIRT